MSTPAIPPIPPPDESDGDQLLEPDEIEVDGETRIDPDTDDEGVDSVEADRRASGAD
jgi:hypothetical protein